MNWKNTAKRRFDFLVRKEASGTITSQELGKLDRYQKLLSDPPSQAALVSMARIDYACRILAKKAMAIKRLKDVHY